MASNSWLVDQSIVPEALEFVAQDQAGLLAIARIKGNADGHCFTMLEFSGRYFLQFVGRPVAEVKRPGRTEFKGVPLSANMVQM